MEKKNPIEEAQRYMSNAKNILREKAELDISIGMYQDRKYIQMAGDTLWKGCLIALDAVFQVKANAKKGQRIDIDDYQKAIGKRDKKLLNLVNNGYKAMHLNMGYDGIYSKAGCDTGFELAKAIIDRCAVLYKA